MATTLKNRLAERAGAIAEAQETALAETNFSALNNNTLEIIRENLKNQPLSLSLFDIVKSPSGGSTVFSIPTISGDEAAKSIKGIILDYTTPRAYWDTPDPVEGTPPVCFSEDSLVSHDGKACATCQFNDYGTKGGDSNAKACKESVILFLLRPDNIMPLVVRVPVTSKMNFLRYMTRLIGKMIPISSVVTEITLEKKASRNGQPYAQFNFEAVQEFSPEEASAAKAFGRQLSEMLSAADISPSDEKKAG